MNISANLSTVAMLCLATVIHAETPPDTSNVECQPKSVSAKNPQNPSVDSILDIQKGITAFNEAKAIKEPEKRIAALEQFIVDYPNHSNANDARAQILKAHAQQYKQEPDRVLREVEATLAKMYRPSSFVLRQVADILTTAGFDKRAEEVARMAVNDASATAEQVERIFATAKADSLAYLGRLQLAHNNLPDAEQSLKQAYAIDPNISGLPASLAGIAERSGKDSEALEYLLAATYWSQPERRKLETLYRKQHQNSLAGLRRGA
ncbi:MAG TPA: hypothetical protein VET48_13705 [Steroidobacteraceae bacterium]|nr:hypothetical protein [Steroidobacteraceae bacterium]